MSEDIGGHEIPMSTMESLEEDMERISPSSLAAHLDPTRPYDGQSHTTDGKRGQQAVHGLTMRDVKDCYIRGVYESSGLPIEEWPGSIHDLPWPDMDPLAVWQNLACNLEKRMGIWPNIERSYPKDPTENHWCGPDIETATWTSHEGRCNP